MNAKTAKEMDNALITSLEKFPKHLCLTITDDNGTENANHEKTGASGFRVGGLTKICRHEILEQWKIENFTRNF